MIQFFKIKFLFKYLIFSLWLLLILFVPGKIFAAELFLQSNSQNIKVGDEFKVDVLLNAEESINAIEGKALIPTNTSLIKIEDGNSILSFWVEPPRVDKNNGLVIFSGITPGGWQGKGGLIFSIIFKAKAEGNFTIDLKDSKTLLNDGRGTESLLNFKPLSINITKIEGNETLIPSESDNDLPEVFNPEIARDPNLFSNQWFVAFSAKDKNSGISKFQIKETRFNIFSFLSSWQDAVSPYLLKDQERKSTIYIKAIDNSGNERVEKLQSLLSVSWYKNYDNYAFIIIVLIILIFCWFIFRYVKKNK